ncbi:hypothetical protein OEZ85_003771 [Tetradesmus obliquus]|uniref:Secreted protein n=1 Tax=Tetradesmus obliquus TaxID=3088 RepID=A0ABY8UCD9_TETOB|nr:hypothetical protein OEZ85_003771 [Tetradesmus obliquus]
MKQALVLLVLLCLAGSLPSICLARLLQQDSNSLGARMVTPTAAKPSAVAVDPAGATDNSNRAAVTPHASSAQDAASAGSKHSSGHASKAALLSGGLAKSATYEDALALAASDSLPINRGRSSRVTVSGNLLTTRTGSFRGGSRSAAFRTSSQPVTSKMLSGAANKHIALAQATAAVATAQAERA